MNKVIEAMLERRSIKAYNDVQVTDEELELIIR